MIRAGLLQVAGLLAGVLIFLPAARAVEPPVSGKELTRKAERGEAIFRQKCSSCHTIGGGDRPTGPDLAGVTRQRDPQWLERFILDPGKMIDGEDPIATELLRKFNNLRMPDLGLSQEEVDAVLAFLALPSEAEHHAPEETARAAAAPVGDPQRGKALFVGTASFANGGAPCLACHGIAGAGLGRAAGASYGPDLTTLYQDYGAEGLASILESLPFPSMEPIYARRPLSGQERADLTAFLAEVTGAGAPRIGGALAVQVAAVAVIFLGLIGILGWRRLQGVRQAMVAGSRKGKGGAA